MVLQGSEEILGHLLRRALLQSHLVTEPQAPWDPSQGPWSPGGGATKALSGRCTGGRKGIIHAGDPYHPLLGGTSAGRLVIPSRCSCSTASPPFRLSRPVQEALVAAPLGGRVVCRQAACPDPYPTRERVVARSPETRLAAGGKSTRSCGPCSISRWPMASCHPLVLHATPTCAL